MKDVIITLDDVAGTVANSDDPVISNLLYNPTTNDIENFISKYFCEPYNRELLLGKCIKTLDMTDISRLKRISVDVINDIILNDDIKEEELYIIMKYERFLILLIEIEKVIGENEMNENVIDDEINKMFIMLKSKTSERKPKYIIIKNYSDFYFKRNIDDLDYYYDLEYGYYLGMKYNDCVKMAELFKNVCENKKKELCLWPSIYIFISSKN